MNNNIEFRVDSFAGLTTLFEYGGTLKSAEVKSVDKKIAYYLDLKTKEDVENFVGYIPEWQIECFENISSLAKALFYCNNEELNPSDISNLLGLLVSLGEIGSYLTNHTMEMKKENTFPKNI